MSDLNAKFTSPRTDEEVYVRQPNGEWRVEVNGIMTDRVVTRLEMNYLDVLFSAREEAEAKIANS